MAQPYDDPSVREITLNGTGNVHKYEATTHRYRVTQFLGYTRLSTTMVCQFANTAHQLSLIKLVSH